MHEMSLTTSILDIIREEMHKHGKSKLLSVRLCYGALSNVVPESIAFAFDVQTKQSEDLTGATLELIEQPVLLRCSSCCAEFTPEVTSVTLLAPCPNCHEEIGHSVLSGKELYIENIEVE